MDNIRNPEGIWINSKLFREAGDFYIKNKYYTPDPWGSPAWYEFWEEERKRCLLGYSIGGAKITGEHYHYLNYCPIQKVDVHNSRGRKAAKIEGFPDFWDGDYNYFWIREIARNGILDCLNIPLEEQNIILSLEEKEKEKEFLALYNKLFLLYSPVPSNLEGGRDLIIGKSRRKGFEQPHSELIMTPNGYTTMGDIRIGDTVLTPTGDSIVIDKFYQGEKDVYEVSLKDGRKVKCGLNHLWKVYNTKGKPVVVTTEYLLKQGLKTNRGDGKDSYKYHIPQTEPVNFNIKYSLPIHPYLLGLLLGDGSVTQSTILFSTEDKELVESIRDILGDEYSVNKREKICQYSLVYNTSHNKNPLRDSFKYLGLDKSKAKDKFIPSIYKYSSVEDRWEIVKGLMDTDGSAWKNGSCNFVNTSEALIDDLAFILRSLGVRVHKSKASYTKIGTSFWTLVITTNKKIFKLKRKNQFIRERCYDIDRVAIVDIKKLDHKEESSCILIDDKEHLYLTKDFIVTHNSYKNASVAVLNFFHRYKSYTMLMAYEKKYLYPGIKTIFGKCQSYINFINSNTGWRTPSDYINNASHIKASYKQYQNGVEVERGLLSEIEAISFKDNPSAGRGADTYDIIGEEVGAWGTPGGLKNTIAAMRSSSEAGLFKTGMMTLFGCVCKGTKVWNHSGELINIEDVTKETGIVSYACQGTVKEPILWIKEPSKKPCYRIKTSKDLMIECSYDHPLLCSDNKISRHNTVYFKKAEDIVVDDKLMIIRQVPIFGEETMKYPRLIGLLIGDGYYGNNSTPQLAIADKGIEQFLIDNNIKYTVYKEYQKYNYKYVGIKDFQKNLIEVGIYGQTKKDKRLPKDIFKYNAHSISELLGGYFDADGSINYNKKKNSFKITLVSVVPQLLEEVKIQLYKFGISSVIYKRNHKNLALHSNINNKNYNINTKVSYSLEIHSIKDIIEFKKHIYFTDSKKQKVLDTVDICREGNNKYDSCIFKKTIEHKGDFFIDKKLDKLEAVKVKSVEFIGEQDVYNLTTEITHTYITNQFISHNTSGELESGTVDFADLFKRPEANGFMAFYDIWGDYREKKEGFFFPRNLNTEGFYDEQGNSALEEAKKFELNARAILIKNGATSVEIKQRMQEEPLNSSEAFSMISRNTFPVVELQARLDKVEATKSYEKKAIPVQFYREQGKVKAKVILNGSIYPINSFKDVPLDLKGCPVIYEFPSSNPPKGLYKIGYDPVRQDQGSSLAAIIVYKGVEKGSYNHDNIVAEYIGRLENPDEIDELAEYFADFFNTQIMHENECVGVKNYFRRKKRMGLLAIQPDAVISKNVKNSRVSRIVGCHMTSQLKDAGERYIKTWLTSVLDYDIEGNPITVIDRIDSRRLLEELISYYREGNFDLISALIMCLFQVQEESLNTEYDEEKTDDRVNQLNNLVKIMYKKNGQ